MAFLNCFMQCLIGNSQHSMFIFIVFDVFDGNKYNLVKKDSLLFYVNLIKLLSHRGAVEDGRAQGQRKTQWTVIDHKQLWKLARNNS